MSEPSRSVPLPEETHAVGDPAPAESPPPKAVHDYLVYALSLPERAVRTTVGVAGGALRESAGMLVPQALRDCQTYRSLVQQTLDFLVEDVGNVARGGATPGHAPPRVEDYVARKTVGNFVEMAGLATLHVSPLLVLAIVSDAAYGSKAYLKELADELRREGIIAPESSIDNAGDLLEAVGKTAGVASAAFDTPPLSVDGLRETVQSTLQSAREIDLTDTLPRAEVERLWTELRELAEQEKVSLLQMGGAVTLRSLDRLGTALQGALSTVRVAGTLVDRHVLDHYRRTLTEIHEEGYYATLAKVSGPYIDAVWQNFSTKQPTVTADLLSGKFFGQVTGAVTRWLGWKAAGDEPPDGEAS